MGSVNITEANGQLGILANSADNVFGVVITGVVGDGYDLGSVLLVTSLPNAISQGVTEANSPFLYKFLKEFYDEAGKPTQLYVLPVANTMTYSLICDKDNAGGISKLINYAQGAIRVASVIVDDADVYSPVVITGGINADVLPAAALLQAAATYYANKEMPFRAIIAGSSFNGVAGDLINLNGYSYNRVGIMLGDVVSGGNCALGTLMGKLSTMRVVEKLSKVKTGALVTTSAFLNTSSMNDDSTAGVPDAIAAKGYITWFKYPLLSGIFFSGDPMACVSTDDYGMLCRGRIMDKVRLLAYGVMVNEVDADVATEEGGTIDEAFATWLEGQVDQKLSGMVSAGEIDNSSVSVDRAHVLSSDNKFYLAVKARPKGYLTDIEVTIGYSTV